MDKIPLKIDHHGRLYKDTVVVNWCLGNTCNYACSYCPTNLHDASKPWLAIDTIKDFCERAIQHYQELHGQRMFFEFTGGEITLFQHFLELIQFLKSRNVLVGIISNGSRRLEFWEKARPHLDHICLSFHPESAKVDHFKQVVEFLNETVSVHVNLMMHPEHFEECKRLGEWVSQSQKNITLAVQPLIIDFKDQLYPYSPEQLEFIKNPGLNCRIERDPVKARGGLRRFFTDGSHEVTTPQQLIASGQNNWKGWYCMIGVKQIVVDMDGNIFRGWCLEGGKVAHVQDGKNIKFPLIPVLCKKHFCHCVLDVMNERYPSDATLQAQIRDQEGPQKPIELAAETIDEPVTTISSETVSTIETAETAERFTPEPAEGMESAALPNPPSLA